MNPTTTPDELLAQAAPRPSDLEREFPLAVQDAIWAGVIDAPAPVTRIRRRWPVVAAVAAAAVALAVAVPALVPGAAPPAQGLDRLARTAATTPVATIPEGSFQHMVLRQTQNTIALGQGAYGPGGDVYGPGATTRTLETWTAADGTVWGRYTESDGTVDDSWFPAVTGDGLDISPAAVAAWPTDPARLEAYLRAHRRGSSSAEENVFATIGDLLRMGYVPADVRRAAIEVLAGLPHVSTTHAKAENGTTALRVDFADPSIRPGEVRSLWFDEPTAALIQETLSADGTVIFLSVTTEMPQIVDEVPRDVLADAEGALSETGKG